MFEVLIISYNAMPMDVVSSYRVKAYCDHFISFGIRPTVLTHRWERIDDQFLVHRHDDEVLVEENEKCRIIRLPYPGMNSSPSSLHTVWSYMNGDLDVSLADSYNIFKKFLWGYLKRNRYQLIIAIYNPHFHLKLAHSCWRKFNIPYVLDFRDLWDNEMVAPSYAPGLKKRIINAAVSWWWRKWIRGSLFFSTPGNKWKNFLSGLSGKDGIVVRNGFDELPANIRNNRQMRNKKFKIIHFGRMYMGQDIDIFLGGFRAFAQRLSPAEIAFEVIGLKKVQDVKFEDKIRKALGEYVSFVPYLPKAELFEYCKHEAALFFFPDFKEDNGSFAVKIYDYMLIGKSIIVAPGGGEVSELVSKINAGVVLNEPWEVTRYLEKCYEEFKKTGAMSVHLNEKDLEAYSRMSQVQIMAEKIHLALSTL